MIFYPLLSTPCILQLLVSSLLAEQPQVVAAEISHGSEKSQHQTSRGGRAFEKDPQNGVFGDLRSTPKGKLLLWLRSVTFFPLVPCRTSHLTVVLSCEFRAADVHLNTHILAALAWCWQCQGRCLPAHAWKNLVVGSGDVLRVCFWGPSLQGLRCLQGRSVPGSHAHMG